MGDRAQTDPASDRSVSGHCGNSLYSLPFTNGGRVVNYNGRKPHETIDYSINGEDALFVTRIVVFYNGPLTIRLVPFQRCVADYLQCTIRVAPTQSCEGRALLDLPAVTRAVAAQDVA